METRFFAFGETTSRLQVNMLRRRVFARTSEERQLIQPAIGPDNSYEGMAHNLP
jgi:hypothetical protein